MDASFGWDDGLMETSLESGLVGYWNRWLDSGFRRNDEVRERSS